MKPDIIYLDHAAATPLDERVFAVMEPYLKEKFYNPSAAYQPAREVKQDIETARAQVAQILGARPGEIVFTAGATESINLAFKGVLADGGHIIVSQTEHQAVLETARLFDHDMLSVDQKGRILLDELASLIQEDTKLISIGLVNNEIGTIQPLGKVFEIIEKIRKERLHQGNTTPLYLHTDASQAAGFLDLSASRLGVDLLTLGSGKFYGPKQMAILFAQSNVRLSPLIQGGGQERGLRSGTENVAGIIGLGEALYLVAKRRKSESERLHALRQVFLDDVKSQFDDLEILGDQKHMVPHILCLAWPGLDAERALFALENENILVATGSACAANKDTRSHVLEAIGLSSESINGSLRFSFGKENNQTQLKEAAKIIIEVIKRERAR